jgi:RNA polymerase sigma factor (sigma-70 family)
VGRTEVGDGVDAGAIRVVAFDQLYRQERADLVRLGAMITGSVAVAEELVHEAFVRMHSQGPTVEHPPGFLRTALVRLCLTWKRRAAMEADRLARLDDLPPVGEPAIDETWDLVMRLKRDRRVALALRFYSDMSYEQIASVTGWKVATARSRVRRALEDLRRELEL